MMDMQRESERKKRRERDKNSHRATFCLAAALIVVLYIINNL